MRLPFAMFLVAPLAVGACKKAPERPENATCHAPERESGAARFELEQRFSGVGFSDSVELAWSPGAPGWLKWESGQRYQ